jgi:hypothetical protein
MKLNLLTLLALGLSTATFATPELHCNVRYKLNGKFQTQIFAKSETNGAIPEQITMNANLPLGSEMVTLKFLGDLTYKVMAIAAESQSTYLYNESHFEMGKKLYLHMEDKRGDGTDFINVKCQVLDVQF